MRLTCPNCGAQYEVPDEVIPQAGRDVQCSNCGDTWFQTHRDHPLPEDDEDAGADTWEEVTPDPAAAPQKADEPADHAPPASDPAEPERPAPAEPPAPTPDRPERREIDPAVASVLREEAEREKRARAATQGGLETQPDLGLGDEPDTERRAREARSRMARMRGEEAHETDPQDIDPASRRSLFPDIEEINSSLAPGSGQDAGDTAQTSYTEATPAARGGFRRGFLVAVLIAVLALLIYVYAPALGDTFPAFADLLADYVAWVNGLRAWLDGQIAALMLWLDGMASTAPPAADGTTAN